MSQKREPKTLSAEDLQEVVGGAGGEGEGGPAETEGRSGKRVGSELIKFKSDTQFLPV